MPIYQYLDSATGRTVEVFKPVDERDSVAAGLRRITVPARVAIHGTTSSPVEETSADGSVPKALKSLSNGEVNKMVKESGMSVDKFKRTWNL